MIDTYITFLGIIVLINLTPGIDTMYILTKSITYGHRTGFFSALGINTGCLFHTCISSFGVAALLITHPNAFTLLKYAGGAYLIYQGIVYFLSKKSKLDLSNPLGDETNFRIYRQGAITNILNPKVALFYLALLPQFIPENSSWEIFFFLFLGISFVVASTIWSLILVFISARAGSLLIKNRKIEKNLKRICGSIFIILGLKLAFEKF